jgi:uncharacterized membrane protein
VSGWFCVLLSWLAFAATHLVPSSLAIRGTLIGRLGERGFRALYSVVALGTFALLVRVYWTNRHVGPLLWNGATVPGLHALAIILSAIAFVLLVAPFFQTSPPGPPRHALGVTRIVRHPVFAAFGLWGLAHTLVNGYLSDVIFFGGWVAFWFIGGSRQDARKRVLETDRFAPFYAETSLLPFGAIVSGRNRLVLREIPLRGVAVGLGAAAALYPFHDRLFGG